MSYCLSLHSRVCPNCKAKGKAYYISELGPNGHEVKCQKCEKTFADITGYRLSTVDKLPPDAIFDGTDYPKSHS